MRVGTDGSNVSKSGNGGITVGLMPIRTGHNSSQKITPSPNPRSELFALLGIPCASLNSHHQRFPPREKCFKLAVMTLQRLIPPAEIDALLRFPRGRAKRLAIGGEIPHVLLPGGEVRFDPNEIHEWLERCKRGPDTEETKVNFAK